MKVFSGPNCRLFPCIHATTPCFSFSGSTICQASNILFGNFSQSYSTTSSRTTNWSHCWSRSFSVSYSFSISIQPGQQTNPKPTSDHPKLVILLLLAFLLINRSPNFLHSNQSNFASHLKTGLKDLPLNSHSGLCFLYEFISGTSHRLYLVVRQRVGLFFFCSKTNLIF